MLLGVAQRAIAQTDAARLLAERTTVQSGDVEIPGYYSKGKLRCAGAHAVNGMKGRRKKPSRRDLRADAQAQAQKLAVRKKELQKHGRFGRQTIRRNHFVWEPAGCGRDGSGQFDWNDRELWHARPAVRRQKVAAQKNDGRDEARNRPERTKMRERR